MKLIWLLVKSGNKSDRSFPGGSSFNSEDQEGDHSQTGMLDLRQLEVLQFLRIGCQAKWVEIPAWVNPLNRVKFGVSLELDVPNHQDFNPDQCG